MSWMTVLQAVAKNVGKAAMATGKEAVKSMAGGKGEGAGGALGAMVAKGAGGTGDKTGVLQNTASEADMIRRQGQNFQFYGNETPATVSGAVNVPISGTGVDNSTLKNDPSSFYSNVSTNKEVCNVAKVQVNRNSDLL